MKTTMQSIRRLSHAIILLALNPATLWGQAVSNPNQITGTISFSNTNPDILAILNNSSDNPPGLGEGFAWWGLLAYSTGVSPGFFNSSGGAVSPPRISTAYSVTVESGLAPDGIRYRVIPHSVLLGGQQPGDISPDFYTFAGAISDPVLPEPAADVILNFSECAGLLDIQWVDEFGDPAAVAGGSIEVLRETEPGSGIFLRGTSSGDPEGWVDQFIVAGRTQEYLAVRGDGARYQVTITSERGADPFSDKVRSVSQQIVVVNCDEILRVDCVLPTVGALGEIVGRIDMLGENEHRTGPFYAAPGGITSMLAYDGPFGNFRYDAISASPSEGLFRFENLVPSDAVEPSRGYRLFGEMSFRTGRRYQYFTTPFLGDRFGFPEFPGRNVNERAYVTAGTITDLGDTFVISPGFVRGNILLAGPPSGPNGSCLEDLFFDADHDTDANGIPDGDARLSFGSSVAASGTETRPTGATLFSAGAAAYVGFEGSFNPMSENFEGDYELALGGLKQQASNWRFNPLTLFFEDVDTPDQPASFQSSQVVIQNANPGHVTIVPGEATSIDFNYCLSQVNIGFRSLAGQFRQPGVSANGNFNGIDFRGEPVQYTVSIGIARGTPISLPSDRGMLVLCMPQGTYTIRPGVVVDNPEGGFSNTQLPPFDLVVGCRQVMNPTLDLQLSLDSLAECTASSALPVSGRVNSRGNVDRIFYTINGGPQIDVCVTCGQDPAFSFEVILANCENEVTVTAVDEFGDEASATGFVRFDAAPPILTGCENLSAKVSGDAAGAAVNFTVGATDNCDPSVQITCDPPSGSFFPIGETTVLCTAIDKCGNTGQCQFTVSVSANDPPVITGIVGPLDPLLVNSTATIGVAFTDENAVDSHMATFSWGDGSPATTVAASDGFAEASNLYIIPGVYRVEITVTDAEGASATGAFEYVVVYDPDGGFVTGGGWIWSPEGAFHPDLAEFAGVTGKANFGFVSKYQKGATIPTGQTQFQFKAGDLNFHSSTYQWLVIAGAHAKYKGTGTVNGGGNHGFMLTATDGQVSGGGGVDKFRIKIWDQASGVVIYDNQPGDPDDGGATTALGGGSIVVHKP